MKRLSFNLSLSKKQSNVCKKIFIPVLLLLLLSLNLNAQITVSSTGDVKLAGDLNIIPYTGNTCSIYPDETDMAYCGAPTKQFYKIYGQIIYGNGVPLTSDKRLKENIRSIDNPLSKILQLSGKEFDFKLEKSDSIGSEKERKERINFKKNKYGFLAQDVKEVLPEVVIYDEEIDRYYIEYISIIPIIVEAMKVQQTTIDSLKTEIATLKAATKEKSAFIEGDEPAVLKQNIPNPFNSKTTIEMYIPSTITNASLYIYNMQGNQIKQIGINERGNSSVTIEGHTLKAGMYLYTLITDGKEVDTKKMILTK